MPPAMPSKFTHDALYGSSHSDSDDDSKWASTSGADESGHLQNVCLDPSSEYAEAGPYSTSGIPNIYGIAVDRHEDSMPLRPVNANTSSSSTSLPAAAANTRGPSPSAADSGPHKIYPNSKDVPPSASASATAPAPVLQRSVPQSQSQPQVPPVLVKDWMTSARCIDLTAMEMLLSAEPRLLVAKGTGLGHTALHWCAAKGSAQAVACVMP